MKNKKGFTLAELLGVIIILAVIAMIVYPIINKTLRDNKEKLYSEQITRIEETAHRWAVENAESIGYEGENYYLTLTELKNYGSLKSDDLLNPIDNSELKGCVIIHWIGDNKRFVYYYDEECVKSVNFEE